MLEKILRLEKQTDLMHRQVAPFRRDKQTNLNIQAHYAHQAGQTDLIGQTGCAHQPGNTDFNGEKQKAH